MGEAKKRGSFEARKAEGMFKRLKAEQERIRKHTEYEASLTPEDKQRRHKTRVMLATMAGISSGALLR